MQELTHKRMAGRAASAVAPALLAQEAVTIGCSEVQPSEVREGERVDISVVPTFRNNTTQQQTIRYNVEIGDQTFGPFSIDVPGTPSASRRVEIVGLGTTSEYSISFSDTIESTENLDVDDEQTGSSGGNGSVTDGRDVWIGTGAVTIENTSFVGAEPTPQFDVVIDGERQVTLNAGEEQTFPAPDIQVGQTSEQRTVTVPGLSPGTVTAAIQQQFGFQQRAECGDITVLEAQDQDGAQQNGDGGGLPSTIFGIDTGVALALGGGFFTILLLLLAVV